MSIIIKAAMLNIFFITVSLLFAAASLYSLEERDWGDVIGCGTCSILALLYVVVCMKEVWTRVRRRIHND